MGSITRNKKTKSVFLVVLVFFATLGKLCAQEEIDTISFKGDYRVLCACVFKGVAVIDVEKVNDPSVASRLYYRYSVNYNLDTIIAGDTIELNIILPVFGFNYRTRYIIKNNNDLELFIYQPVDYNKAHRLIALRNDEVQYNISKKCPKSIISKVNWFTWRYR